MKDAIDDYSPLKALSQRDFGRFSRLAYDYCGLSIEAGKEHLVASRLSKLMRPLKISSYGAYYDYVVADKSSVALVNLIDNLTTNHTSFFREQQHFDFLANTVFPALRNRLQIDIWSAACSTGEEPYSIAFAAKDFYGVSGPTLRIFATDISTRVLETAKKAIYNEQRFRGLSKALLKRHMLRGEGASAGLYRVKPEAREAVHFQRFNLNESFHSLTTNFPLILCRNAMIYFDAQTQEQLVERFYQQLEPGGHLFIGHSESLNSISHRFEYVCPAIYRKPGVLKERISNKGEAA